MNLRILPPAREEIREAYDYYEGRKQGLGHEFSVEVANAVEKLKAHPSRYPKIDAATRKCRTNRFPYAVLYRVEDDSIIVVAVMHQKRRPGYWKGRS